ncbi:TPA: hypothetical protein ACKP9S_006040 [Pseudomonas aeruginosa]
MQKSKSTGMPHLAQAASKSRKPSSEDPTAKVEIETAANLASSETFRSLVSNDRLWSHSLRDCIASSGLKQPFRFNQNLARRAFLVTDIGPFDSIGTFAVIDMRKPTRRDIVYLLNQLLREGHRRLSMKD